MGVFLVALTTAILLVVECKGETCTRKLPRNCADVKRSDSSAANGVYTIQTGNHQSLTVYCIFGDGVGYTYISPANTADVIISELSNQTSHVMVRHKTREGVQKESKIEQINDYASWPMSIQYASHDGYNGLQNSGMTPYLYVGLLPQDGINHRGDKQGYKANGDEYTFTNCDANPNSYFAFLFNQNNVAPTGRGPVTTPVTTGWIDSASIVPADQLIPDEFFSFYEMHMGGCGAFLQGNNIPSVPGAALGLQFDIECGDLPKITHGSVSTTGSDYGSVATYSCDSDYTLLSGDITRTCTSGGVWSGSEPVCGEPKSYSTWSDWTECQQSRQRTLLSQVGDGHTYKRTEMLTRTCAPTCGPKSCRDVKHVSGVYTLYNGDMEPYTVFCLFKDGYGYTYLAPTNKAEPSMNDIFEDASHVMIRTRKVDGTQKEVRIQQISAYSSTPLTVQYNQNVAYNSIRNKKMGPFTYMALLPRNHVGKLQGFKANGADKTFTNCDGNMNSYFAFLHNHKDVAPIQYLGPNNLMSSWINAATPVSIKMPASFFSFFEVHMGGCGGFVSLNHYPDLTGAALGLRFEL